MKKIILTLLLIVNITSTVYSQIGSTFEKVTTGMGKEFTYSDDSNERTFSIIYSSFIPALRYKFIKTNNGTICVGYTIVDYMKNINKAIRFLDEINGVKRNGFKWTNEELDIEMRITNDCFIVIINPAELNLHLQKDKDDVSVLFVEINGVFAVNGEGYIPFLFGYTDEFGETKIINTILTKENASDYFDKFK